MCLCNWSWKRTGSRSASTHSARACGSSSSNTGLNSTACEPRDVGPQVAVGHPAAGTFQVHDQNGPRVHRRDVERAAGLDQDRVAAVGQRGDQRMDLRLGQRLAPCDLDQPTPVVLDFGDDARETAFSPSVKRIGGVAPRAAQGTSGQSDKHTETTGVGGLPLNAEKDFSEAHGRLRLIPTQDGPTSGDRRDCHRTCNSRLSRDPVRRRTARPPGVFPVGTDRAPPCIR